MIPGKAAFYLGLLAIMAVLVQCNKDDKSINFFSVNQDIEFGASMDTIIMDDPAQFPLLSEAQYPTAYQHIRRIRDNILASGELNYKDRFPWVVKIIHNDTTLNAFAAPGGYMYFYTGSILGDNPSQLAEIAAGLASGLTSLAFSRQNEYEADEYAVRYLSKTDYDPRGLAGFFEKMEGQTPFLPVFLSTHPSPDDRLDQIYYHWEQSGSNPGERYESRYNDFKNSLPPVTN
ncbi:MAG: M48 family metalloprotease [Bacteroidales bacterium]|nr:M48 family metalloprotease [Bacteroidales bacterium]